MIKKQSGGLFQRAAAVAEFLRLAKRVIDVRMFGVPLELAVAECQSSGSALPEEENLWTVPIFRQWPLSSRVYHRSAYTIVCATSRTEGTESFCEESIEWKSRSRDSGVGAGTKLVSRSIAEEDDLDRFLWGRQLKYVKAVR